MSYPKLTPIITKGATEPRYLEDRFADIINVKDFGAKGDGVTDDADAFQAAAESLGTYPVQVYIPAGTYYLSRDPIEPATASANVDAIFWYIDAGATIAGEGKLCNYPIYMGWPTNWYLDEFLPETNSTRYGNIKNSMRLIETDSNPITRCPLTLTMQTKHGHVIPTNGRTEAQMSSDYNGLQSLVVNNAVAHRARTWAGYFESTRTTDMAGGTLGIEVTIADVSPEGSSDISPYGQLTISDGAAVDPYHASVLIWGGAGGELFNNSNDITALAGFTSGGARAKQGFVFNSECVRYGSDGFANILCLAKGHAIRWWASKKQKTAGIFCGVGAVTDDNGDFARWGTPSELHFGNDLTRFVTRDSNNNLYSVFQINHRYEAVNGLLLTPNTTSDGPLLEPTGPSANADIRLRGKGTGLVRFGTYEAFGDDPSEQAATGYITIKDINGTERHILCW